MVNRAYSIAAQSTRGNGCGGAKCAGTKRGTGTTCGCCNDKGMGNTLSWHSSKCATLPPGHPNLLEAQAARSPLVAAVQAAGSVVAEVATAYSAEGRMLL